MGEKCVWKKVMFLCGLNFCLHQSKASLHFQGTRWAVSRGIIVGKVNDLKIQLESQNLKTKS